MWDHHTTKVARIGRVEIKLCQDCHFIERSAPSRDKEEFGLELALPRGMLDSTNRSRQIYSH